MVSVRHVGNSKVHLSEVMTDHTAQGSDAEMGDEGCTERAYGPVVVLAHTPIP